MANLLYCIECGGKVSGEAIICPHCRRSPSGSRCEVCNKIYTKADKEIHDKCYENVNTFQHKCPVCKVVTNYGFYDGGLNRIGEESFSNCKGCGHPFRENRDWVMCEYCRGNLPIENSVKFRIERKNGDDYPYWVDVHAHKVCYASHKRCFIATAAMGSSMGPEIESLQFFRDSILRNYVSGRAFIICYESISPFFAKIISRVRILQIITKYMLVYPSAWLVKKLTRKTQRGKVNS